MLPLLIFGATIAVGAGAAGITRLLRHEKVGLGPRKQAAVPPTPPPLVLPFGSGSVSLTTADIYKLYSLLNHIWDAQHSNLFAARAAGDMEGSKRTVAVLLGIEGGMKGFDAAFARDEFFEEFLGTVESAVLVMEQQAQSTLNTTRGARS